MNRTGKSCLIISCVIAALAGGALGQVRRAPAKPAVKPFECTRRIETSDWKLLIAGVKVTNPQAAERLETDVEFQKSQAENLKDLLAYACEAVKEGILKDPVYRSELENTRIEVVATEYDKLIKKADGEPAFSTISPARITNYYTISGNSAKFDEFLKVKIELMKRGGQDKLAAAITKTEIDEAKKVFAKVRISEADSRLKAVTLDRTFWAKTGLTIKLQQAQFLSKLGSERESEETSVSDAEIAKYIAAHSEFDVSKKKEKAAKILARAKAGEDFAALANEFTEDPGNGRPDGTKAGGIYRNVPKGMMIGEFEKTALSLNAGEVSPDLVETEFGYHIIKLEKKGDVKKPDGTSEFQYDVRHILISTQYKDPANPAAREVPVRDFVRDKLEREKEESKAAKLVKENAIVIAPFPSKNEPAAKPPVKKRPVRRAH